MLSQILDELKSLKDQIAKRDEDHKILVKELTDETKNHKTLVTRLTEEVKTLRVEVSQLKKITTVIPLADNSPLKALPLTSKDAIVNFDHDLQQDADTRMALVS